MELRQSTNKAIVVGKLMDMSITTGVTKKGDNWIGVNLIVKSIIDGRENENEVKLFATEKSKLYKSYSTIANEYRPAKLVGTENADRIRVDGELIAEKFISSKTGKINNKRKFKGTFVNRIENADIIDEVGAEVECVVVGSKPELDRDGVETGRLEVKLMTVGYGNNIMEFERVFVNEDLAGVFPTVYNDGDTAVFFLHSFNYSEAKGGTEEDITEQAVGFGRGLNNKLSSNKIFVNEINIVGGNMPQCDEGKFYTDEEIAYMNKLIQFRNDELMAELSKGGQAQKTQTQQNMAFGSGLGTPAQAPKVTAPVEDDEIPF